MASRPNKRLYLSCLYLGALFLAAGTLYYAVQAFFGVVVLQRGGAEQLAFRPAAGGLTLGLAQRNVPPDLLMFDNPRVARVLRQDQQYDGLVLPFSLRLETAEIIEEKAPNHLIRIETPDGARTAPIAPGARIDLDGASLEIAHIGPWQGLIRRPGGAPHVAIRIGAETPGGGDVLLLEAGAWRAVRDDLAVHFAWGEAAGALPDALDEIDAARWGVRDGRAVQWLESFTPGTGLRLRDGRTVTLRADRRDAGHILLNVTDGAGNVEEVAVRANVRGDANEMLLDDPAAAGRVLLIHAAREDRVHGRLIVGDQPAIDRELATGETWELPPDGLPVQVAQAMPAAVAVAGDAVSAAYARFGERDIALHEGLLETIGGLRVQYLREQPPPDARYRVAAILPDGSEYASVTLEPGVRARVDGWVLSLAEENPFAPNGIAVAVERRPGGPAQIAGLALFIGGSFGLVVARFRRRAD